MLHFRGNWKRQRVSSDFMAVPSGFGKGRISGWRCEMAGTDRLEETGDVLEVEDKPARKKEKKPDGGKSRCGECQ